MAEITEGTSAARRAAQLMAILCTSAGGLEAQRELMLLVHTNRITLADFTRELTEIANERGAAAYTWDVSDAGDAMRGSHDWRVLRSEEIPGSGEEGAPLQLDVVLRCERCSAMASFRAGGVPPCTPGRWWKWTGTGWQRDG